MRVTPAREQALDSSGLALVVKSRSGEVRPRNASRTGPPTSAISCPAAVNSPQLGQQRHDRGEVGNGLLEQCGGRLGEGTRDKGR